MHTNDLLLVIDMQNVYKAGQKWACLDTPKAAQNILSIIKKYKSTTKNDVIFTRYLPQENPFGVWKNYNIKYHDVNNDSYANEMIDELKEPLKEYPLYTKGVYSSLEIPEVLEACQKAERVIITGVVAECCVLSTVLALIDKGIYTIYLTDGVSGLDRPKEQATELILSGLCPLHVSMMTTQEYLNEI